MAIKSYYKQTLRKGKFEVKYDEESGKIEIKRETNPYLVYSNSIWIEPKDFKYIKQLVESLDIMKGDK